MRLARFSINQPLVRVTRARRCCKTPRNSVRQLRVGLIEKLPFRIDTPSEIIATQMKRFVGARKGIVWDWPQA